MAYIESENARPIKEHDVDQIVGINHIESHQQVEYHVPTKGFHLSRYQFHVGSCRAFLSPKKVIEPQTGKGGVAAVLLQKNSSGSQSRKWKATCAIETS